MTEPTPDTAPRGGELDAGAEVADVLMRWHRGVRIEHIAHSRAATRCDALNRGLGLAVVTLGAIVGTSVFSTIETSPSTALKIVAGLLALAASVLAALQTFLAYAERAARHSEVAARYGSLRRRIEALLASPPADFRAAVEDLQSRWDDIEAAQPHVAQRIHDAARRQVLGDGAVHDRRGRP